uniref:XRCC4 N-terminal domain-containing protein n=1 Tax=Timema tahoe TaxID=61484 RepID=A0A7R9FMZ4_9NEOP|nr:unnamed protein product [Timema tahoe]
MTFKQTQDKSNTNCYQKDTPPHQGDKDYLKKRLLRLKFNQLSRGSFQFVPPFPQKKNTVNAHESVKTRILPKEGSNKFYRLQTEWDGESFSMLILDEVSAWTGKLSSLELNHLSRQLFLGNEEYINETRKALTSDGGDEQFTYAIENHQFSWKKVDVETDIRVKYGFVHLMNVPVFEAFENMIDILLDRNQFLQQQVKNLENLKDSMEKGARMSLPIPNNIYFEDDVPQFSD